MDGVDAGYFDTLGFIAFLITRVRVFPSSETR